MAEVSGEQGVADGRTSAVRDRKRDARVVAAGVVVVLIVWFALANLRSVPVCFWVVEGRYPMIAVVVISCRVLVRAPSALRLEVGNQRLPAIFSR